MYGGKTLGVSGEGRRRWSRQERENGEGLKGGLRTRRERGRDGSGSDGGRRGGENRMLGSR